MLDLHALAGSIAEAALGEHPGPMTRAPSRSYQVFVGASVVVKITADHSRLDRELSLAAELPAGLSARVLAGGRYPTDTGDLRYACLVRLPGTAPGMGLPGVDRATARRWAQQAVRQLRRLHAWVPAGPAAATLRENLDHGGFTGRARLLDGVRDLDVLSRQVGTVSRQVLDGLAAIADRAPDEAAAIVPVHADCHWDNWLVHDGNVTALLDFEWARFGEPADDWMFLARFSGPHLQTVLGVIADETGTPPDALRGACEVRELSHLTADLRFALRNGRPDETAELVRDLTKLVIERSWWQPEP